MFCIVLCWLAAQEDQWDVADEDRRCTHIEFGLWTPKLGLSASCVVVALHVQAWQCPTNICRGKKVNGLNVVIVANGSECTRGADALLDLLVVVL